MKSSTFEQKQSMKNLIIASTSTVHGSGYLEYILPEITKLFNGVNEVLFIPYARPSGMTYDEYTDVARSAFEKIQKQIIGIHEMNKPIEAVNRARGIFIGGGNTFLLVKTLYEQRLLATIISAVENGTPYFGTSAGSNITGPSMMNTNDMPIVYPPSFKTFGFINFNLNPHYLDPVKGLKHMGETRETRINEFHVFNSIPVLGLREGSWLRVEGSRIALEGSFNARLFQQNKPAKEITPGTDLSFLR
jgi:dipeptidase E